MNRIPQRSKKQKLLPLLVALCGIAPGHVFGALYPVEQNSNPSGLVSTSGIIEGGQTYQSIDPQLNKNGYTFGYWAIDGVRQQGADGRSLTRVSSVINAESNYTAYYYGDNVDSDGDGVKDWFEYRMFGDLSSNPTDDSDGDGFSNKRESELGQDALIVDFMEAGGVAGRMSNTLTYADTSMLKVTIKSNPTGYITTSVTNREMNASVATQSLNGATFGAHFAYWTINGVRQASPNGVARSEVSLNISGDTEIVAHYIPSTEDSDGDGVMDWFELYQFGNLVDGPEDDSDGDGFSNKREGELGQEATIAEFTEAGGIAGRMSNTLTYADTSMLKVTIRSNPAGFIATTLSNKQLNTSVTTQSLNGGTYGSHFAYWTINGVRQTSPNGVASSKASAVITEDTEFVAHYVPSSQDSDGDGVMDWFEKYQFGNLDLGPNDDPDGDGFSNKREGELGQEATIAEFTEMGGIAGRMSNSLTYYVQQNRPPSNLELNNTIVYLNKEANRTVGSFTPTDPDDPGRLRAYTYRLLNQPGGEDSEKYNLLGNQLRASQTFTLEGNHSILVRVTDDENAFFDKNFTIRAIHDPNKDDDSDGLTYSQENSIGTSDNNPDTDGDGFSDSLEASSGSDPNNPNSTPFNHGLVAWYPFDGNASDMSGNGNDLSGSGHSFGEDRYGVSGKSCRLNQVYLSDTNASFSIDDNASFSYSLWVQVNSVPSAYPEAFGLRDITGNWDTLRIGTYHIQDQDKFAVDHLSTGTNSSHAVKAWANHNTQLDRWYQITLVSSLSEVKLFIDSSLQSTIPFQRDALKNNNVAIYVGGAATWNLFNGSVDDVRIYNRALSEDEISLLYRAESPNHFVDSAKDLEMIWVEPGTFTMGQVGVVGPEHNVTLTKGFYLGKYEVTQAQYEAVMTGNDEGYNSTPSNFSGNPNHPVERVNFDAVLKFIELLNQKEAHKLSPGWNYALPTDAEWEYACRAGTRSSFSWGKKLVPMTPIGTMEMMQTRP